MSAVICKAKWPKEKYLPSWMYILELNTIYLYKEASEIRCVIYICKLSLSAFCTCYITGSVTQKWMQYNP